MATKIINVPDIGGATDVDVIEILVKVGDHVKVDSPLISLESDKATMEIPSPEAGVVKEIKVKVGSKVSVGAAIVVLEAEGAAAKEEAPKTAASKQEEPKKEARVEKTESTAPAATGDIHASPIVRRLAYEFGIDLKQIRATGPKQRIQKEDIQNYVKNRMQQGGGGFSLPEAPKVDFSQFGSVQTKPLSRIKKLTAKNLHRNWMLVPHVTQFGEADISELEAFRVAQKSMMENQGVKLTPLIFVMKAVVAALKIYPQFNASLDSSGENLILKNYFHIGIAVDTPDGLVVPVIRDVDKKGMVDLAKELAEVSEKARNKQLTSFDMQGGCFTISSLGGIGGTAFTPIVNLPEVAILGVSKAAHKPFYEDGQFVPRLMLPLSLSYDHRVIDGAEGARFIVSLANMLSDIRNLLL